MIAVLLVTLAAVLLLSAAVVAAVGGRRIPPLCLKCEGMDPGPECACGRGGRLAAVAAWVTAGRLEPGQPHRYAPDASWPGSCWCGSADKAAPVHARRTGH
jgi:hypothetical protein